MLLAIQVKHLSEGERKEEGGGGSRRMDRQRPIEIARLWVFIPPPQHSSYYIYHPSTEVPLRIAVGGACHYLPHSLQPSLLLLRPLTPFLMSTNLCVSFSRP